MQLFQLHLRKTLGHYLVLALIALPLVSGCGGCRSQELPDKEQSELDKDKKPKPDFELTSLVVLPSTLDDDDEEQVEDMDEEDEFGKLSEYDSMMALSRTAVKPGHWVQVRHRLRANNFDFVGDLNANVLDRDLRSVKLERSPYRLVSTRPMSLPKEQQKYIDVPLFIPDVQSSQSKMLQLGTRLRSRTGSRVVDFGGRPTVRLSAYQFFFVVLSDEPERYGFLKTLTVVRPPDSSDGEWDALPGDYAVKFINAEQPLPLPTNSLAWTSTAYTIWDDFDPAALSTDQQTALVDWLFWGGRLIISGPTTLDRLRGSFLEPYLPALADRTLRVNEDAIEQLNNYWKVYPREPKRKRSDYDLKMGSQPMEVVQLELQKGGKFVAHTAELVAERRLGRGLITTTAFSLTDRRMVNWPGFDSFCNGCLMRRSSRRFAVGPEGDDLTLWHDSALQRDATRTCGLRYFVRDAQSEVSLIEPLRQPVTLEAVTRQGIEDSGSAPQSIALRNQIDRNFRAESSVVKVPRGYISNPVSGVAGWTDFSSVANAARYSLQACSGISVPDRSFVARVLGAYLLCLVPLNWLLFRLIGRVEWAWVAAPVLAVLGGVGIVKMAELDIGFVRARTELAVVEMQADYPRAHVTRYTGLYTSLSSDYAVAFEDVTALAAPFSTNPSSDQLRLQIETDVRYRQAAKVGLSGFPVISNSTGMLHVEQILDTGGAFRLTGEAQQLELTNDTPFGLSGAFMLFRDSESSCQIAVIGDVEVGGIQPVRFESVDPANRLNEHLNEHSATMLSSAETGQMNLRQLMRIASSWHQLDVGGYRLVGWNDQEVPGMSVRPDSNQATFRTLVVANVRYAPFPEPQPDKNLYESFKSRQDE